MKENGISILEKHPRDIFHNVNKMSQLIITTINNAKICDLSQCTLSDDSIVTWNSSGKIDENALADLSKMNLLREVFPKLSPTLFIGSLVYGTPEYYRVMNYVASILSDYDIGDVLQQELVRTALLKVFNIKEPASFFKDYDSVIKPPQTTQYLTSTGKIIGGVAITGAVVGGGYLAWKKLYSDRKKKEDIPSTDEVKEEEKEGIKSSITASTGSGTETSSISGSEIGEVQALTEAGTVPTLIENTNTESMTMGMISNNLDDIIKPYKAELEKLDKWLSKENNSCDINDILINLAKARDDFEKYLYNYMYNKYDALKKKPTVDTESISGLDKDKKINDAFEDIVQRIDNLKAKYPILYEQLFTKILPEYTSNLLAKNEILLSVDFYDTFYYKDIITNRLDSEINEMLNYIINTFYYKQKKIFNKYFDINDIKFCKFIEELIITLIYKINDMKHYKLFDIRKDDNSSANVVTTIEKLTKLMDKKENDISNITNLPAEKNTIKAAKAKLKIKRIEMTPYLVLMHVLANPVETSTTTVEKIDEALKNANTEANSVKSLTPYDETLNKLISASNLAALLKLDPSKSDKFTEIYGISPNISEIEGTYVTEYMKKIEKKKIPRELMQQKLYKVYILSLSKYVIRENNDNIKKIAHEEIKRLMQEISNLNKPEKFDNLSTTMNSYLFLFRKHIRTTEDSNTTEEDKLYGAIKKQLEYLKDSMTTPQTWTEYLKKIGSNMARRGYRHLKENVINYSILGAAIGSAIGVVYNIENIKGWWSTDTDVKTLTKLLKSSVNRDNPDNMIFVISSVKEWNPKPIMLESVIMELIYKNKGVSYFKSLPSWVEYTENPGTQKILVEMYGNAVSSSANYSASGILSLIESFQAYMNLIGITYSSYNNVVFAHIFTCPIAMARFKELKAADPKSSDICVNFFKVTLNKPINPKGFDVLVDNIFRNMTPAEQYTILDWVASNTNNHVRNNSFFLKLTGQQNDNIYHRIQASDNARYFGGPSPYARELLLNR